MRVVVDSNCLQSDELWAFLNLSRENRAVITDYAAMEAFKANTLVSIQESWRVLRQFPAQVLVLKGTKLTGLLNARSPGIANRMISKGETRAIPQFASLLDRAAAGEQFIIKQLLQRGKWAKSHMDWMLGHSDDMALSITEFANCFSPDELARIRKRGRWTEEMAYKFDEVVLTLTRMSFNAHPAKPSMPIWRETLKNHFLYRHAFTYAIYMLQLIESGARTRRVDKARNDAVDVIFATYATYFNGLMSRDERASKVHLISRTLLTEGGARIPPDYLDGYAPQVAGALDARNAEQF